MLEGAGILQVAPQLLALVVMTAVFITLAGLLFRWHE